MKNIFLVYFLVYETIELSCMESMIVYSENVCRLSAYKCMGMKKIKNKEEKLIHMNALSKMIVT